MTYLKNLLSLFLVSFILVACSPSEKTETSKEEETEKLEVNSKASIEEIEAGIRRHIAEKTQADGGYFIIEDTVGLLKLQLVRVHTEYLSSLGPNRQFACVDLADINGDVYDVDFFLEDEAGNMHVTETSVHKLNGKPFYSWKQQKDKTWFKIPLEQSNNRLFGVIEGEDEFEFYYEAIIPKINQMAQVWIPIPQSDPYQEIKIKRTFLPVKNAKYLSDTEYGNTILFMDLLPEHSGETIAIHYQVKRKEKSAYPDSQPDISLYLAASPLLPTDGKIRETALIATSQYKQQGDLAKARAIYDYIIDNMKYIKNGIYGTGDALYACDSKTGNCTEFHSLFIAMARSVGVPARFAIGAAIPADRNEGGIDGYHCWAEFYAEGKWWPVDISEANKYSALATYYFGRHPANRIELSTGRDLKVAPLPASGPMSFLAYPHLELDGQLVAMPSSFSFKRE